MWSETAFYGFTHRGFYNLTRKADGAEAMDPLQVSTRFSTLMRPRCG